MIRIKYDLSIYDLNVINRATDDYSNLCKFSKELNNREVILEFSECLYGENRTAKEFNNYLIDLMGASNGN